jgi:hypothetical protein
VLLARLAPLTSAAAVEGAPRAEKGGHLPASCRVEQAAHGAQVAAQLLGTPRSQRRIHAPDRNAAPAWQAFAEAQITIARIDGLEALVQHLKVAQPGAWWAWAMHEGAWADARASS